MTDNEIIKALECCAQLQQRCDECPERYELNLCGLALKSQALKLINRQKAEIERLENSLAISKKETKRYVAQYQTIQSETVKRVAFMLRAMGAGRLAWDEYDEEIYGFLTVDEIDNLLKEFMEGGNTQ